MTRFISSRYILVYLLIVIGLVVVFQLVVPYYTYADGPTPYPIDSRVMIGHKLFDWEYVSDAKMGGYNIPHYYYSFFIIDLFFPVAYTLFALSVFDLIKKKREKIYTLLRLAALATCLFDYLENFSFAIFLQQEDNGLARFVAAMTTFKSLIILIPLAGIIGIAACAAIKKIKQPPQ